MSEIFADRLALAAWWRGVLSGLRFDAGQRPAAYPIGGRSRAGRSDLARRSLPPSLRRGRPFDLDLSGLLGRSEVEPDAALMAAAVAGKRILITGAGGTIGGELAALTAALGPARLVLLDSSESGLYEIGRALANTDHAPRLVLGSAGDALLTGKLLREEQIDTIFHCAAHKHVPLLEENPAAAIRNNLLGTSTLAAAACEAGTRTFVLISSDKAVRPVSIMGATKRWSELLVRHYGTLPDVGHPERNFVSVRFGNVVGSSGSVIPLFAEQISAGGPVTVTDPDMKRYFMSVREAASLIVQASGLSRSGDVLLLDMGDPIRIIDLARHMIGMAGRNVRDADNPRGDIAIEIIGTRPGEKLEEELSFDMARAMSTSHPMIRRLRMKQESCLDLAEGLRAIEAALESGDARAMRTALFDPRVVA